MTRIILFDNETRNRLLPFTFLRPVCELRVGILTIREKWERWMKAPVSFITQDYLAEKYPLNYDQVNYLINGSALPSRQLVKLLQQMEFNEAFLLGEELIAAKLDQNQFERLINEDDFEELRGIDIEGTEFLKINRLWDLFRLNDEALREDFELLTQGRASQPLDPSNRVSGAEHIFLEKGARVEHATINAQTGPVYIGPNAQIMEGALVRGPFAMGEASTLKMGAKVYGATTLGPDCKVGGEVNNVILFGHSSKSHDGYLGNSVIGEWCNLGAGTSNSNLKNTYEEVRVWSYETERFEPTGLQFCGLFMGDHSKCAINTIFNTGTVIGVGANIFGSGFPRNFVPSFAWGGHHGFATFRTDKAFETIERVMARRNREFDIQERLIMLRVFEDTTRFRRWDKR